MILNIFVLKKWNAPAVRWAAFGINLLVCFGFIFGGLNNLAELREHYLSSQENIYFTSGPMFIYIRYLCFALFTLFLFQNRQLLRTETFAKYSISRVYTGCIMHFFILVVLSNELVNINHLQYFTYEESYYSYSKTVYKLGFTILWSVYSFILIAWGIFRKNKIARISAISFFGLTLIKLVTFDTWDLSTGYKVVAYLLLGAVLLLVAFLYQKFKALIFGDDENELRS
jgi:hypothetical protein